MMINNQYTNTEYINLETIFLNFSQIMNWIFKIEKYKCLLKYVWRYEQTGFESNLSWTPAPFCDWLQWGPRQSGTSFRVPDSQWRWSSKTHNPAEQSRHLSRPLFGFCKRNSWFLAMDKSIRRVDYYIGILRK